MKKMMKQVLAMTLATVSVGATFAGCGSKEKVSDDENTLQLFISNFGYGIEWLDEVVEDFKNETWVKEKYPNLNVPKIASNSEKNYPIEQINSGKTTVDLFISTGSAGSDLVKKNAKGENMYENMNDLFATKIPGENVTVAEKMQENYLASCDFGENGETNYMHFPWVAGYIGFVYNETLVKQYLGQSFEMPATTNELVQMAETLKANPSAPATFVLSGMTDYWSCFNSVWWAQYSGLESVNNFFNGVAGDERSPDVFKDQGRLEMLKVMQSCLWEPNGYVHEMSSGMDFTEAQSKFLSGDGIMMVNGDWVEMEMQGNAAEINDEYVFKIMKNPVISSIIDVLPDKTVTDDATLSAVVKAVDNGASEYAGVSANDFNRIKEARNYISTVSGHYAYIPSYSTAKGLAKDFLLFMSQNSTIETFMTKELGVSTAFDYDLDTTSTTYQNFSDLQKSRLSIIASGAKYTNVGVNSRLVYYGGMAAFQTNPLETKFIASSANDRMTAEQIFDRDLVHWTGVNSKGEGSPDLTYWNLLLTSAGLN